MKQNKRQSTLLTLGVILAMLPIVAASFVYVRSLFDYSDRDLTLFDGGSTVWLVHQESKQCHLLLLAEARHWLHASGGFNSPEAMETVRRGFREFGTDLSGPFSQIADSDSRTAGPKSDPFGTEASLRTVDWMVEGESDEGLVRAVEFLSELSPSAEEYGADAFYLTVSGLSDLPYQRNPLNPICLLSQRAVDHLVEARIQRQQDRSHALFGLGLTLLALSCSGFVPQGTTLFVRDLIHVWKYCHGTLSRITRGVWPLAECFCVPFFPDGRFFYRCDTVLMQLESVRLLR